jgi:hypothetical protein
MPPLELEAALQKVAGDNDSEGASNGWSDSDEPEQNSLVDGSGHDMGTDEDNDMQDELSAGDVFGVRDVLGESEG